MIMDDLNALMSSFLDPPHSQSLPIMSTSDFAAFERSESDALLDQRPPNSNLPDSKPGADEALHNNPSSPAYSITGDDY